MYIFQQETNKLVLRYPVPGPVGLNSVTGALRPLHTGLHSKPSISSSFLFPKRVPGTCTSTGKDYSRLESRLLERVGKGF